MKYGDFSSLVQLGAGLHAGTALLQLYGEIGLQPLMRTIARIRSLTETIAETNQDAVAELAGIETDFAIFRIRLFNEYKRYVLINSAVAVLLVVLLVVISYAAEQTLPDSLSVIFVGLSILPAPATLGALWFDASKEIRPLKARADALERKLLRH